MTRPLIVLTGAPSWTADVRQALGDNYTLVVYADRAGYVARLTETQAALIIVPAEAAGADWRFWTATPKSSPATRRIPIILVTDDDAVRHESLTAGADLALASGDFLGRLAVLVEDYARVPDPDLMAQLDCECQESLPPLAIQGIEKFNAGEYYRQHDLFEALWVKTEGPVRDLYRAILQVGVAYYQIERGNYRGALKMLQRSVQWLAVLPDVCQGVDVQRLREDSHRVRAALERLGEAGFSQFDKRLIQPVFLVDTSES